MIETITTVITNLISGILTYLPQFFAGLLILLIGLLIAAALKKGVLVLVRAIRVEKWLEEAGVAKGKSVQVWVELFAELVRWTVIVLFLIPAAEIWGIPRVTNVLNQLLMYLPNVFIAAIVGLVGAVAANFVSDIIRHGSAALGSKSANAIAAAAYYAIIFFTVLIVLNQLGVASDLVRILFNGIMIGRGVFHNPFVFNENVDYQSLGKEKKIELLLSHIDLHEKTWGDKKRFAPLKRFFKIYITGFDGASEIREKLMETKNVGEARDLLK